MTLEELYNILKATGFPVAYLHFKEPQNPPFICYLVDNSQNFIADNKVYHKISDVSIELYTNKKDLATEEILETLLDQNEIPYVSDETFIESEQLFLKIYEVRLI
jgi:hypothetical protein